MKDRSGAKKLYKANKTWVAAGIAAATLFSVSVLGGQTVSADTTGRTAPAQQTTLSTNAVSAVATQTLRTAVDNAKLVTPASDAQAQFQIQRAEAMIKGTGEVGGYVYSNYTVSKSGSTPVNLNDEDYANQAQVLQRGMIRSFVNGSTYVPTSVASYVANNATSFKAQVINAGLGFDKLNQGTNAVDAVIAQGQAATTAADNADKHVSNVQDTEASAAKQAAADRTAAITKLGDAVNAIEEQAATRNLPDENEVNKVIADGIQAYQDAQAGKTTTAAIQEAADNLTTYLNVLKSLPDAKRNAPTSTTTNFSTQASEAAKASDQSSHLSRPSSADVNFSTQSSAQAEKNANLSHRTRPSSADVNFSTRESEGRRQAASVLSHRTRVNSQDFNFSTIASNNAAKAAADKAAGSKTDAGKPGVKVTPVANKTNAAAKKTLPKTGDSNNVVAAGVGAVAVLGALFGLAGDRRKRA